MTTSSFADALLAWFDRHGRHDLPWLQDRSPYRVWLSEVMLQQTQVSTAIGYFLRFVSSLPGIPELAAAPLDQVLGLWSGLGYYSRARNLHRAAQIIVAEHSGQMPQTHEQLVALPGIGRSTAGAILAQAFGQRAAILDGNVKRVLSRLDGIREYPGLPAIERQLWQRSTELLPERRLADYTQALMDLGATLCTPRRPACLLCPVAGDCVALASDQVDQIPKPKPRKPSPVRTVNWLLMRNAAGQFLLEQRPPVGIWGGLWSLPEAEDTIAWVDRFALSLDQLSPQSTVKHVFTHFQLQAQVWEASTPPTSLLREAPNERWFARAELGGLGLPAPIRRLLLG